MIKIFSRRVGEGSAMFIFVFVKVLESHDESGAVTYSQKQLLGLKGF